MIFPGLMRGAGKPGARSKYGAMRLGVTGMTLAVPVEYCLRQNSERMEGIEVLCVNDG